MPPVRRKPQDSYVEGGAWEKRCQSCVMECDNICKLRKVVLTNTIIHHVQRERCKNHGPHVCYCPTQLLPFHTTSTQVVFSLQEWMPLCLHFIPRRNHIQRKNKNELSNQFLDAFHGSMGRFAHLAKVKQ
ncbi:hypothetical protein ACQJBY_028854 [Aegilops geniculata]